MSAHLSLALHWSCSALSARRGGISWSRIRESCTRGHLLIWHTPRTRDTSFDLTMLYESHRTSTHTRRCIVDLPGRSSFYWLSLSGPSNYRRNLCALNERNGSRGILCTYLGSDGIYTMLSCLPLFLNQDTCRTTLKIGTYVCRDGKEFRVRLFSLHDTSVNGPH